MPVVLLVIFVLLYITYGSAIEAAHVLLAVPFALTGGVYLLWLLGYNFSVAVWVGFIALFGTAVQTGVVMVIYLEEAVERKTRERRRPAHALDAAGRGDGGRPAPAAPEGDDRLHGRGGTAADHVEHQGRCGSDEAARHARAGRDGVVARSCADRHAGHLFLDPRTATGIAWPDAGRDGRTVAAAALACVRYRWQWRLF